MDPLFNQIDRPYDQMSVPDRTGSAGRPASSWPAGPVWAPPANEAPPATGAGSEPDESSEPAPRSRRWTKAAAATVAVAVLGGGVAGYAGASLADGQTTIIRTPAATSLSFNGSVTDVASLVKTVRPSVVSINSTIEMERGFPFGGTAMGEAAGTGIILTSDGEILTNAHVVAGATSITVLLAGETTPRQAELIGADSAHDVALIKLVDASGLPAASIGDSDAVTVGDDAIAIGNALGLEGDVTVSKGIISALDRSIEVESGSLRGLIQTDASISSGNSGGPLVNAGGEVIGMNSAGASSSSAATVENIGFAIPINAAMAIVAELREQS